MACLTLHSRLLAAAANMSVVCETLTNLGKQAINELFSFFFENISLYLVEHLVQWFSSSNVIELQPTAISLDIHSPTVEMKLKQVILKVSFVDKFLSFFKIYLDSSHIRISSRNN